MLVVTFHRASDHELWGRDFHSHQRLVWYLVLASCSRLSYLRLVYIGVEKLLSGLRACPFAIDYFANLHGVPVPLRIVPLRVPLRLQRLTDHVHGASRLMVGHVAVF